MNLTMIRTYVDFLNARLNLSSEEGQTAVEYALVLALVAIVLVGVVLLATGQLSLGSKVNQALSNVEGESSPS